MATASSMHLALRRRQLVVGGLVHQDVDDDVVEAGINTNLGQLVPAEIVDAPKRLASSPAPRARSSAVNTSGAAMFTLAMLYCLKIAL